MPERTYLAIDPGEHAIRIARIRIDGAGRSASVVVERATSLPRPTDVDAGDVEATATWLGQELARLKIAVPTGAGSVLFVLDREQATIRPLELPTTDPDELPDMARLTMARDTHVEGGALAVDFLERPVPDDKRDANALPILVAAASQRVVDDAVRLAKAIGAVAPIVTLRVFGAVALVLRGSGVDAGATVLVDATEDAAELAVLKGDEIVYTRGVRVPDLEAVPSEIKRSWMSYRFSQQDETIARAICFGPASARTAVDAALGKVVGAPIGAARVDEFLRSDGVDAEDLATVLPLAGLALERFAGGPCIDLASPRRAPDRAARRRTRVLAAAGVLVLAGLTGWTIGNLEMKALREDVEALDAEAGDALPRIQRFRRDRLKLEHIETWASVGPRWLEHVRYLHEFAPDPSRVVLNTLGGSIDVSDVQYRDRKWSIDATMRLTIDGEARDRAVADALRDALVEDGLYAVTSTGADTEGGRRLASPFAYVLRTAAITDPFATARASGAAQSKEAKP
jgi:hypothetical protein